VDGRRGGTLEGACADRLQAGDGLVLEGRALEFRRMEGLSVLARAAGGEPNLPRWTSDRQGLSPELARALAAFREQAGRILRDDGPDALRAWLGDSYLLEPDAVALLADLFAAQEQ